MASIPKPPGMRSWSLLLKKPSIKLLLNEWLDDFK
jgi:hypothetical protein